MFITLLENNKKAIIMIYKRLLAFLLSFALIFSSTSALANTSLGGWTALDTITAGATNTINAAKSAGGKALKSAVTVAPSAAKVGKHLIKGGGYLAVALAVSQIAGDSVDWVLDPANNRIKYTPAGGAPPASDKIMYSFGVFGEQPYVIKDSPKDACDWYGFEYAKIHTDGAIGFKTLGWAGDPAAGTIYCHIERQKNGVTTNDFLVPGVVHEPIKDGGNEAAPQYIPINVFAEKVIANAEAGHAPSQEAVKATALEGFVAGEHDAALDAAAVPDTGVENPTDPNNPAEPVDPAKPVDLSPITAAINALKAILSGILSSITSLTDWFKGEPEANKPEDNKIDIPEVPLPDIDSSVSFGGSCPSDLGADFNLYGTNFNFVLMPFSKLCPLLSTFIKPTLILLGSFMAVAIVGGRKDA